MKSFQFKLVKEENGKWIPVDELSPVVTANTLTNAMNDPELVKWCNDRGYRIYKVVGK